MIKWAGGSFKTTNVIVNVYIGCFTYYFSALAMCSWASLIFCAIVLNKPFKHEWLREINKWLGLLVLLSPDDDADVYFRVTASSAHVTLLWNSVYSVSAKKC